MHPKTAPTTQNANQTPSSVYFADHPEAQVSLDEAWAMFPRCVNEYIDATNPSFYASERMVGDDKTLTFPSSGVSVTKDLFASVLGTLGFHLRRIPTSDFFDPQMLGHTTHLHVMFPRQEKLQQIKRTSLPFLLEPYQKTYTDEPKGDWRFKLKIPPSSLPYMGEHSRPLEGFARWYEGETKATWVHNFVVTPRGVQGFLEGYNQTCLLDAQLTPYIWVVGAPDNPKNAVVLAQDGFLRDAILGILANIYRFESNLHQNALAVVGVAMNNVLAFPSLVRNNKEHKPQTNAVYSLRQTYYAWQKAKLHARCTEEQRESLQRRLQIPKALKEWQEEVEAYQRRQKAKRADTTTPQQDQYQALSHARAKQAAWWGIQQAKKRQRDAEEAEENHPEAPFRWYGQRA